jgi:toxin secretion/phage lysis holin
MELVNKYNAIVGSIVMVLTAFFGQFWYLFAAFLVFNIIDWLTGWAKARKLKQESSQIGLKGILKKVGYWVIILVAFMIANILVILGQEFLRLELSFLLLFGWFTLASLMVNEVRSILENLVEMGYKVPEFLIKGLAVTERLINEKTVIGSD